jgi:hypothetical protein
MVSHLRDRSVSTRVLCFTLIAASTPEPCAILTLIDTAPVYGFGRSEEIVGKALAARVIAIAPWGARRPERLGPVGEVIGWCATGPP